MTERESSDELVLDAAEGISAEPITQWDLFVTRLRRHRLAMLAFFYMAFVTYAALMAPLFTCEKNATFCGSGPIRMSFLTTILMIVIAGPSGYLAYRSFKGKMRGAGTALAIVAVISALFLISSWGIIDLPHINHYADQLPDEDGRILVNIAPRSSLPMGTDDIGRDVLSRVIHGGRASLAVGIVVGALVALLGTVVGALAGYYPGVVDQSLMRFTDLVLGLPLLPVAIVVGRVLPELRILPGFLKQGAWGIAVLLGALDLGWSCAYRAGGVPLIARKGICRGREGGRRQRPQDHLPAHFAQRHKPDHRADHFGGGHGHHCRGSAVVPWFWCSTSDPDLGRDVGRRCCHSAPGLLVGAGVLCGRIDLDGPRHQFHG